MRFFMGLSKYTPNDAMAGDMGWKPAYIGSIVSYNFENILCWKPQCILLFTIDKLNALLADLATALAIN
jgi:hypothetical protein